MTGDNMPPTGLIYNGTKIRATGERLRRGFQNWASLFAMTQMQAMVRRA